MDHMVKRNAVFGTRAATSCADGSHRKPPGNCLGKKPIRTRVFLKIDRKHPSLDMDLIYPSLART